MLEYEQFYYAQVRKVRYIAMSKNTNSLILYNGKEYYLTTDIYSKLLLAVLTKFVPRFAHNATLLFISDIAKKPLIYEREQLEKLEVPIFAQEQLPSIILYQEARNWLYLIDIVTPGSSEPISHKRRQELERILADCLAERKYLSVFQKRADFAEYAADIAWESYIWIASLPEHIIHYNGDKPLGPHKRAP